MKTALVTAGFLALMIAFAPLAAKAQDAAAFTDAQKKELSTVIHDYLMENPKVIMEAVEKYRSNQEEIEAKAGEAAIKTRGDDIYKDPGSPITGNPKGDVVMVEFFDYNCGYCKIAFKDVQTLVGEDKNLKVVFKEIPILSESSNLAAHFALAADKQGKYWEYHSALMTHQGALNEGELMKIAKDLKLDEKKLKADSESADVKAEIEKNLKLARDLGVTGTPGFIVADKLLRGHYGIEALRKIVTEARAATSAKKE